MASLMIFDMLQDGLNCGRVIGTSTGGLDNKCLWDLPSGIVRQPNYCAVCNGWVIKKMSFKLSGGDLHALEENVSAMKIISKGKVLQVIYTL
jgi:hypothetical protein